MSQHSGHTDSDGMISDMGHEGSGMWRSEFPDDSDFGGEGSGSGDGYSGELSISRAFTFFVLLEYRELNTNPVFVLLLSLPQA